jgi:lysozyme
MALFDVVIDVSDAQGRIDWSAVAAKGVKVAMAKATEGADFTANTWHVNQRDATDAGIKVVPYHFVRPVDVATQVAHFQSVAGLSQGMAYALDWECNRIASAADFQRIGEQLAEITGRTPLGYWGIPGSTPEEPTEVMDGWERWVPRYRAGNIADFTQMPPQHTTPGVDFLFWQYTPAGRISGINGPVDRSVASFVSIQALLDWCQLSEPQIA